MYLMYSILLCFFIFIPVQNNYQVYAQDVEIPSSFNPVGSGARALGMGGAFIGVADDATAASWNPGGLVQLEKSEISIVGSFFHRIERLSFENQSNSTGSQSVSEENLNYLSIAHRFSLFQRNMIFSLNYQNLYDFSREWNFSRTTDTLKSDIDHQQNGKLSAMGLAYCIEIIPQLSFGFTWNIWKDGPYRNQWTVHQLMNSYRKSDHTLLLKYVNQEKYSFNGMNYNIGILWHISPMVNLGIVYKTSFNADLEKEITTMTEYSLVNQIDMPLPTSEEQKIKMPSAFGIGVSFRLSDQLTMSADIYRTEWQKLIITDSSGKEFIPIIDQSIQSPDIDPTHQLRWGIEYLLLNPKTRGIIPLRAGLFYDPSPNHNNPDDYYGFSLGSGFAKDGYVFDIAMQMRFGNDCGSSMLPNLGFSQDMREITMYSSLIIHF